MKFKITYEEKKTWSEVIEANSLTEACQIAYLRRLSKDSIVREVTNFEYLKDLGIG